MGRQDLHLIEPVVANLESLARHGDTARLEHIRANYIKLTDAAKSILDALELNSGLWLH